MEWETVIGLEVHLQLATRAKLFSGAPTLYGATPNTQASMIDLALPGTLPVLNEAAVAMACKFGLAVDAEVNLRSVFARKNYFYPDLPKGYQISQMDDPIIGPGVLSIPNEGSFKDIHITRAHLEEDAGKSVHGERPGLSGIDLNRAGVPLLEVVSEPELRSAKEAVSYLKTLHSLVRYLEICDGNMQEGSFRCDANVSVRPKGALELGTRTEIKNVNSFRFVERAINYEVARQIELLEQGLSVKQETRLYDADKDETRAMRSKEAAHDYRYFPDPDLLPLILEPKFIEDLKAQLPELPKAKAERFIKDYQLSDYDAGVLSSSKALAHYYEAVLGFNLEPKMTANWVTGELLAALNKNNLDIEESPIQAPQFAGLLIKIQDQTLSGKLAKAVFEAMWQGEGSAEQIIEQKGLVQINDETALNTLIDAIIAKNPKQLAEYHNGKDKLFGFFVGQAMKESQGRANPEQLNALLKLKLQKAP